jgi:hypothetical protein
LEIYRQVFSRSARMGISYVIMAVVMVVLLTGLFTGIARLGGSIPSATPVANIVETLGFMVVPFGAFVALLITTPIYLLFVADKNTGLLEYLLAVGMGQRDIFRGYLKASFLLSLVGIGPMILLNLAIAGSGLTNAVIADGLSLLTGLSDVALVTVLMTAYSSMQRKPTGMNSPVGISIGIVLVLPEFFLISLLGRAIIWLDLAIGLAIFAASAFLLASINKIIVREKLLP